ncbi:LysR family transcriptional regulator, partial [Cellulomonas bogoriensis 69B4 = DSM 16987]
MPGTTPQKWVAAWRDRTDVPLELVHAPVTDQLTLIRAGDVDMGLVRLGERPHDLHAIPLYTETTVVVVPADHVLTAVDEVSTDDLEGEVVIRTLDDPLTWQSHPGQPAVGPPPDVAGAVELVAAGVGLLVVPQSLARLHHRRDLTYRPLTGAPTSTVQLAWHPDRADERTETFVGV